MKKSIHKKAVKKHGKYFCTTSIRWIGFIFFLSLIAWGNLFYQASSSSKVLGISTTIYRNCSFWDLFCPLRNFFSQPSASFSGITTTITNTTKTSWTGDIHAIPLGDGKYTTFPKRGYIYTCQTTFPEKGGAGTDGGWISGSYWDLTKKIAVLGNVNWPNAQVTITTASDKRIISGNGLPVGYTTGTFPIASTDPAYAYDRNPNSILAQPIALSLPLNPQFASSPSCVGMGMIGVALDGVPIFNGLDTGGRDAVAHEVQDSCNGHPQQEGMYHYHGPSSCLKETNQKNTLVGYALDGYGIYSIYDANGKEYTDANLDECHGITNEVLWNGKMQRVYHYVMTREYPYSIGCFRGSSVVKVPTTQKQGQGMNQGRQGLQMMPAMQGSGMPFPPQGRPQQPPMMPPQQY